VKTKVSISKRNLILFGLPIFGLMLGLIGNFALVAPQKSKAQQLDAQVQAAQAQLAASRQPAKTQKPAKAPKPVKAPTPQSVQAADLFRLTKAMPDSNDMPGVLINLSILAASSSVDLQSVTPSAIVALSQGYGALPLAVVIQGKFEHVADFLRRLRQQAVIGKKGKLVVNGRLFLANEVAMTSTDGVTVSATLNLDAFVYGAGLPAPAPAVGPTGAAGTTSTTTTPSTG
jgi:Tfp pilus assembly protein PilO